MLRPGVWPPLIFAKTRLTRSPPTGFEHLPSASFHLSCSLLPISKSTLTYKTGERGISSGRTKSTTSREKVSPKLDSSIPIIDYWWSFITVSNHSQACGQGGSYSDEVLDYFLKSELNSLHCSTFNGRCSSTGYYHHPSSVPPHLFDRVGLKGYSGREFLWGNPYFGIT